MPAETLDNHPQLNQLLIAVRDAVRPHLTRQKYGRIHVDGPIDDGIIGKVECGVVPKKDLTPFARKH